MLSKKSFGIAGAAMLGTVALLGTNAANAAMNLDADEADGYTATFAQETVTEATDDAMMYYKVSDTDGGDDSAALDVMSAVGVGAAQDETLIVTYTLTGMVFGADLMSDSLTLGDKIGEGERVLTTGGMADDTEAVFHMSNGDGDIEQTDVMMLNIDMLGVMASGGMISVSVRHELNTSGQGTSPDNMGMVMFDSGVVHTNNGRNAMTFVVDSYLNFGPGGDEGATADDAAVLSDDVGSFSIGTQHLNAQDGTDAGLVDVFGAEVSANSDAGRALAMITFDEMMFTFAEDAWLQDIQGTATCPAEAGTDRKSVV